MFKFPENAIDAPETSNELSRLIPRLDAIKAELEEIRLGDEVQSYFKSKNYSTEEAVNWFWSADQSIYEAIDEINELAFFIDAIENPAAAAEEEEEEEEEEEDSLSDEPWLGPNGITTNSLEKLRNNDE